MKSKTKRLKKFPAETNDIKNSSPFEKGGKGGFVKEERIAELETAETSKPKLSSIKLSNYKFFYGDDDKTNKFDFNGKNVLIYGENGSGKSSIYRALELLTKDKIEKGYFTNESNIFEKENTAKIKFSFTNEQEYELQSDLEDQDLYADGSFPFLRKLFIFKPMLDYKKLLKIFFPDFFFSGEFIWDVMS